MVVLVAFYILLMHICSDHYLLPSGQIRRSNAFSPCQEPLFAGRQKLEFLNAGCWHTTHIISTTFASNHFCNHPRKHVGFKPTIPTSCNLLVLSVLATSGNLHPTSIAGAAAKGNDSNLDKYINSQSFAPPGACPLRTGKTPTKTQAAAERKAKKEAKGKEAEGKKLVAAARRANAKNKKQERLITAAKTKAQKAVAKADELRKKLDNAKKAIKKKSPAFLTGGAQSNKKIKGAAGKSTPTSTTVIASFVKSPQCKAFSAKKRVDTHSLYRYRSLALLTWGSSKSSSMSASDGRGEFGSWEDKTSKSSSSKAKEGTLIVPPHFLGVPALKQGGRRHGSPKGRGPKQTKVATYTLAKFDSDSNMGSDSGSKVEGSNSHKDNRSSSRAKAARKQSVSDEFEQEEKDIIKGIFPGNYDQSLTSRFVAHHFVGVWDDYAPFNRWAEAQALRNPESPILIAMWKVQKTVSGGWAQGGDGNSTVLDDDDSGEVDSKVCNKTRMNYKKTLPAVGFNSPPPQAPKLLFQREEHGVSPTFASSRKSGQRDIRKLFSQAQRTLLLK